MQRELLLELFTWCASGICFATHGWAYMLIVGHQPPAAWADNKYSNNKTYKRLINSFFTNDVF